MYKVSTVHHRDKDNKYLYNQSTNPFGRNQSSQEHLHIKQNIDNTLPD